MPDQSGPHNDAKRDQIFPFWAALGRARAGYLDGDHGRPWESEIPLVQKAWSDLTTPHHLDLLLAWLEAPGEKNPVAQEASLKAVETCRARMEAGEG